MAINGHWLLNLHPLPSSSFLVLMPILSLQNYCLLSLVRWWDNLWTIPKIRWNLTWTRCSLSPHFSSLVDILGSRFQLTTHGQNGAEPNRAQARSPGCNRSCMAGFSGREDSDCSDLTDGGDVVVVGGVGDDDADGRSCLSPIANRLLSPCSFSSMTKPRSSSSWSRDKVWSRSLIASGFILGLDSSMLDILRKFLIKKKHVYFFTFSLDFKSKQKKLFRARKNVTFQFLIKKCYPHGTPNI